MQIKYSHEYANDGHSPASLSLASINKYFHDLLPRGYISSMVSVRRLTTATALFSYRRLKIRERLCRLETSNLRSQYNHKYLER